MGMISTLSTKVKNIMRLSLFHGQKRDGKQSGIGGIVSAPGPVKSSLNFRTNSDATLLFIIQNSDYSENRHACNHCKGPSTAKADRLEATNPLNGRIKLFRNRSGTGRLRTKQKCCTDVSVMLGHPYSVYLRCR